MKTTVDLLINGGMIVTSQGLLRACVAIKKGIITSICSSVGRIWSIDLSDILCLRSLLVVHQIADITRCPGNHGPMMQ